MDERMAGQGEIMFGGIAVQLRAPVAQMVVSLESEEMQLEKKHEYPWGRTSLLARLDQELPSIPVIAVPHDDLNGAIEHFWMLKQFDSRHIAKPVVIIDEGKRKKELKGKGIATYDDKKKKMMIELDVLPKAGALVIHDTSEGKQKSGVTNLRDILEKPRDRKSSVPTPDKLLIHRNQPRVMVKTNRDGVDLISFFQDKLDRIRKAKHSAVERKYWEIIEPDFKRIFSDTAITLNKLHKEGLVGGEIFVVVEDLNNQNRGKLVFVKRASNLELQIQEDIRNFLQKMKEVLFLSCEHEMMVEEIKFAQLGIPNDLKKFLEFLSDPTMLNTIPSDWLLDNPALWDEHQKYKFIGKLHDQLKFSKYADPFGPVDRILGIKFYDWANQTDTGDMTRVRDMMFTERKATNYAPVASTSTEKGEPSTVKEGGSSLLEEDAWETPKYHVKKEKQRNIVKEKPKQAKLAISPKEYDSISEDLSAFFRNMGQHFEKPPKTDLEGRRVTVRAADQLLQKIKPEYGGICFELHYALGKAWVHEDSGEHVSAWDPVIDLLLNN